MVIGSMGVFSPILINGVFLGGITHLLTIDPNFLGHPSWHPERDELEVFFCDFARKREMFICKKT